MYVEYIFEALFMDFFCYRWLPSSTNLLPPNASHQVGVGALVLNNQGDVLVVREKNGELIQIHRFPFHLHAKYEVQFCACSCRC